MLRPHDGHLRHLGAAKLRTVGAAGVEGAAGRAVNGTGYLSAERNNGFFVTIMQGKDRPQKGPCIRVERIFGKTAAGERLHHYAEIHHHDPVRKGLDQGQIVADKQDGKFPLPLESHKQLHQLVLGGDIQGRGSLVTQKHLGFQRQGAGNPKPLALTPAHGVGIPIQKLLWEFHHFQ